MHKVIYMIVEADGEQEAVEAATDAFNTYLNMRSEENTCGSRMDYCQPMEAGHTVSGSDRWSSFAGEPLAAPLHTGKGQEWLAEAKQYTREGFAALLGRFVTNVDEDTSWTEFREFAEDSLALADDGSKAAPSHHRDELVQDHEEFITTLMDSFARYYAKCLAQDEPHEAFIFDNRRYDDSIMIAESPHYFELVDETTEVVDGDSWVVPLDVHY